MVKMVLTRKEIRTEIEKIEETQLWDKKTNYTLTELTTLIQSLEKRLRYSEETHQIRKS